MINLLNKLFTHKHTFEITNTVAHKGKLKTKTITDVMPVGFTMVVGTDDYHTIKIRRVR